MLPAELISIQIQTSGSNRINSVIVSATKVSLTPNPRISRTIFYARRLVLLFETGMFALGRDAQDLGAHVALLGKPNLKKLVSLILPD